MESPIESPPATPTQSDLAHIQQSESPIPHTPSGTLVSPHPPLASSNLPEQAPFDLVKPPPPTSVVVTPRSSRTLSLSDNSLVGSQERLKFLEVEPLALRKKDYRQSNSFKTISRSVDFKKLQEKFQHNEPCRAAPTPAWVTSSAQAVPILKVSKGKWVARQAGARQEQEVTLCLPVSKTGVLSKPAAELQTQSEAKPITEPVFTEAVARATAPMAHVSSIESLSVIRPPSTETATTAALTQLLGEVPTAPEDQSSAYLTDDGIIDSYGTDDEGIANSFVPPESPLIRVLEGATSHTVVKGKYGSVSGLDATQLSDSQYPPRVLDFACDDPSVEDSPIAPPKILHQTKTTSSLALPFPDAMGEKSHRLTDGVWQGVNLAVHQSSPTPAAIVRTTASVVDELSLHPPVPVTRPVTGVQNRSASMTPSVVGLEKVVPASERVGVHEELAIADPNLAVAPTAEPLMLEGGSPSNAAVARVSMPIIAAEGYETFISKAGGIAIPSDSLIGSDAPSSSLKLPAGSHTSITSEDSQCSSFSPSNSTMQTSYDGLDEISKPRSSLRCSDTFRGTTVLLQLDEVQSSSSGGTGSATVTAYEKRLCQLGGVPEVSSNDDRWMGADESSLSYFTYTPLAKTGWASLLPTSSPTLTHSSTRQVSMGARVEDPAVRTTEGSSSCPPVSDKPEAKPVVKPYMEAKRSRQFHHPPSNPSPPQEAPRVSFLSVMPLSPLVGKVRKQNSMLVLPLAQRDHDLPPLPSDVEIMPFAMDILLVDRHDYSFRSANFRPPPPVPYGTAPFDNSAPKPLGNGMIDFFKRIFSGMSREKMNRSVAPPKLSRVSMSKERRPLGVAPLSPPRPRLSLGWEPLGLDRLSFSSPKLGKAKAAEETPLNFASLSPRREKAFLMRVSHEQTVESSVMTHSPFVEASSADEAFSHYDGSLGLMDKERGAGNEMTLSFDDDFGEDFGTLLAVLDTIELDYTGPQARITEETHKRATPNAGPTFDTAGVPQPTVRGLLPAGLALRTASLESTRAVVFVNVPSVIETYSANAYDRGNCEMTVTFLQENPDAIRDIKLELNAFKLHEMAVHAQSRDNTHIFPDV